MEILSLEHPTLGHSCSAIDISAVVNGVCLNGFFQCETFFSDWYGLVFVRNKK